MCDFIPNELIVGYRRGDLAGIHTVEALRELLPSIASSGEALGHQVDPRIDSLDRLLTSRHMSNNFPAEYHRVNLPAAYEDAVIRWLYRRYEYERHALPITGRMFATGIHGAASVSPSLIEPTISSSEFQHAEPFIATRNTSISAAVGDTHAPAPAVYAMHEELHSRYLEMVNCAAPPQRHTNPVLVAVIDSGIDQSVRDRLSLEGRLDSESDLVNSQGPADMGLAADDEFGHGSVMTRIVADGAPSSQFAIVRVLDASGRGSEWELLGGIAVAYLKGADILNLSLAVGFSGRERCHACGRRKAFVRAYALQHAVESLEDSLSQGPLLIAAAGNDGGDFLAYPAQFSSTISVAGVNAAGTLGAYSNRGRLAWQSEPHPRLFVAPGGEGPPDGVQGFATEWVAEYSSGHRVYGTSAAVAYASAAAARVLSTNGNVLSPSHCVDALVRAAQPSSYGNGLINAPT